MAGLVPAIQKRRCCEVRSGARHKSTSTAAASGWPGQARPWRAGRGDGVHFPPTGPWQRRLGGVCRSQHEPAHRPHFEGSRLHRGASRGCAQL